MKAYRIHLTSWTASFRYPNLISGYQPSLVVPPLSTIYGLISAAVGDYICAYDVAVGYVFKFSGQTVDLETIYQFNRKSSPLSAKSNVIRRQILFDNSLWLYVRDKHVAESFLKPCFQLLLGRSNDLASVDSVDEIVFEPLSEMTKLRGTVAPMGKIPMSAPIQALPIGFTDEIPRRSIGTHPFFLLEFDYEQPEVIPEKGFCDPDLGYEIYWHDYTERQ
ncbi:MAG: type I-B CRISPR-associated protein Cas5b [Deltaproteobacteria bacterium]|jgi:CRISPR-associated protein Cas5t|nr:type I-B CRISPR-associated protein Cas5b [Deltaproteobacteria bacterium]